jgi:hypothetical protein
MKVPLMTIRYKVKEVMNFLKNHKIKAVRDGDDLVFTIPRKWTDLETKEFVLEFDELLYGDSRY